MCLFCYFLFLSVTYRNNFYDTDWYLFYGSQVLWDALFLYIQEDLADGAWALFPGFGMSLKFGLLQPGKQISAIAVCLTLK